MTTRFVAKIAGLKKVKYSAASMGVLDPSKIAEKVLPGLQGGQLFAYMFRRFGYSPFGWDDRKNLVYYIITTPRKDVFLSVCPYMAGDYSEGSSRSALMFGYCVEEKIDVQITHVPHREREDLEIYKDCMTALETAMHDLLRPVFVRDVPINCYGRVLDEDFDDLPKAVEPYHAAGYPIFSELFQDLARYEQFIDALCALGGGDAGKGMAQVIELSKPKA